MNRRGDALISCRQTDGALDKKTLDAMVRRALAGTNARSAATRSAATRSVADTSVRVRHSSLPLSARVRGVCWLHRIPAPR